MELTSFFQEYKRLVKDRRIKGVVILLGVILLLYLAIGSWLSKIKISEQKVLNAWGELQQYCDARLEMIPQFFQLVYTFAPEGQSILQPLATAYEKAHISKASDKSLLNPASEKAFISLQREVVEGLRQMEEGIRAYPMLAQNRQYFMLKMQLEGIEQQILFSVEILNREIAVFNYHISGFPQRVINSIFLHKKTKTTVEIETVLENHKSST